MSTARDDLARTWSGRHGGDLDLRLTDTCLRDGSSSWGSWSSR